MEQPTADTSAPDTPPLVWCDVLEQEYQALYGSPPLGGPAPADSRQRLREVYARIHAAAPSAVCLSGGGIRSATFALGVLQGLAHLRLLDRIDYLSTVSGGGYTGGWLTTWLHRVGRSGRDAVLRDLDPANGSRLTSRDDTPDETSPIERVRRTCRYLAPAGGIVSADAWSLVTTMARNLVLNWLVILPILAAVLLVPRVYYATAQAVEQGFAPGPCLPAGTPQAWFLLAAIAGFSLCTGYLVMNFVGRAGRWSQGRFLLLFLAPLVMAAIAFTLFWSAYPCQFSLRHALIVAAAVPAGGWLLVGGLGPLVWGKPAEDDGSALRVSAGLRTILAALAAGPILGLGAYWFSTHEFGFGPGDSLRELYAVFAVPIVLGLVLLQMMVFVGLASSELDDAVLEWWSRAGAWIAIVMALWVGAGVLVFYLADVIEAGLRTISTAVAIDHITLSAVFAGLVPLVSSLAGLAARSGGEGARPSRMRVVTQAVALPAIIVILLSSVAWANLRGLERLEYHRLDGETLCGPAFVGQAPCHPAGAGLGEVLMLGGALLGFGLLMSAFVPVNRFSLHGMYRQRLVRTFLGASRPHRQPNAFTGFDAHDDVRLHELAEVRPLHVVNVTLNAVSSTHIGRHERQAQSFTFTPLHVGNQILRYRPAAAYGSDGGGPGTGLSFGMALAVSGAAVSSSLGIYSSKARAFLLTLANARLGLWFGNPQDASACRTSDPPLGVGPIVREMLGLTTDRNPYVYLTDGGHYENLGLWEMVARRCHLIIVSDAGCDPDYSFADLANAVRRIRLDLGIPVQFPPLELTRTGQGHGNPHVAVGTIRYAVIDGPDAPDGTIVYLKATLSGDEPVDVLNFATTDPTFPHDSTGDQFFDEARFESYRTLGFHTVLSSADVVQHAARTARAVSAQV